MPVRRHGHLRGHASHERDTVSQEMRVAFHDSVANGRTPCGLLHNTPGEEIVGSYVRAVPEIILGGGRHIFFPDPSTPRTHMGSEPPDPQDT